MRKLTEILRLRYEAQLSHRAIARSVDIGLGTVSLYLKRFQASGLSWPLSAQIDEVQLAQQLFPNGAPKPRHDLVEPDFAEIHQELKRKGVTRQLLWEEYRGCYPEQGYGYTQFCQRYKDWRGKLRLSMRQVHKAGEKLFVDYAGQTVAIVNPQGGECRKAHVFVAVLGASNYTYAEATWTQSLSDWLGSHIRAFEFLGGVTQLVVPDNLKSGVSKACRYEPDVNPSYQHLAGYYGTVILPARPYKPKDKAKAEAGVQLVERWILARLRHQTFFTLSDLNHTIRQLLERLNHRPFKKLPGTRRSQFEALDQPALLALPKDRYELTEIKLARVNIDYHLEFDQHYYSVPCALVREQVEVQATSELLRVRHRGKQVACHVRSRRKGGFTTCAEHMPKRHRKHQQWTPGRLLNWAQDTGPEVLVFVQQLLKGRAHPEQGYRACLGVLNLSRSYGAERLNAACARALQLKALRVKSVRSILQQGLDQVPLEVESEGPAIGPHENVRGAHYYH